MSDQLPVLDDLIAMVGLPVRSETLERAWEMSPAAAGSERFHGRVRDLLAQGQAELMILVTLVARPDSIDDLERATTEFVAATRHLEGAVSSVLYRSATDRLTLTIVERFSGREAMERHVASDYFRRFQVVQAPLIAQPVTAVFFDRVGS